MDLSEISVLAGFLVASYSAGVTGVLFKPGDWYERLRKPSWKPSNRLFAPVWSVLYFTIGISGWLVWLEVDATDAAIPFIVFTSQLILNAAWSAVFFGLRRVDLAFLEIFLLWFSILATIALFLPIRTIAALLLLPYLTWVSFAMALNYSIWRLNSNE